jgi:hypothetical protein
MEIHPYRKLVAWHVVMLDVGEIVDFEFEQVQQDSFDYRATVVRRRPPAGLRPI